MLYFSEYLISPSLLLRNDIGMANVDFVCVDDIDNRPMRLIEAAVALISWWICHSEI